jgi:excisionase family DNA binding protein
MDKINILSLLLKNNIFNIIKNGHIEIDDKSGIIKMNYVDDTFNNIEESRWTKEQQTFVITVNYSYINDHIKTINIDLITIEDKINDKLYKLSTAAQLLDISTSVLRRKVKQGEIKGIKIGKQYFIESETIDKLKEEYNG